MYGIEIKTKHNIKRSILFVLRIVHMYVSMLSVESVLVVFINIYGGKIGIQKKFYTWRAHKKRMPSTNQLLFKNCFFYIFIKDLHFFFLKRNRNVFFLIKPLSKELSRTEFLTFLYASKNFKRIIYKNFIAQFFFFFQHQMFKNEINSLLIDLIYLTFKYCIFPCNFSQKFFFHIDKKLCFFLNLFVLKTARYLKRKKIVY